MSEADTSKARLGFRVDSLDATISALEVLNVEIISPVKQTPWGMRAVLRDPDGHRVELGE